MYQSIMHLFCSKLCKFVIICTVKYVLQGSLAFSEKKVSPQEMSQLLSEIIASVVYLCLSVTLTINLHCSGLLWNGKVSNVLKLYNTVLHFNLTWKLAWLLTYCFNCQLMWTKWSRSFLLVCSIEMSFISHSLVIYTGRNDIRIS